MIDMDTTWRLLVLLPAFELIPALMIGQVFSERIGRWWRGCGGALWWARLRRFSHSLRHTVARPIPNARRDTVAQEAKQ